MARYLLNFLFVVPKSGNVTSQRKYSSLQGSFVRQFLKEVIDLSRSADEFVSFSYFVFMRSPLDDESCVAVSVWPGSGPGGCRSPCSSRWSSGRFPGTCWSRSCSPTHCPSRSSFPPDSDSLTFLRTQTESPGYKHPGRRVAQLIKESHIYRFFKLMLMY